MKSTNHQNTNDQPNRAMGHQKKVVPTSGGSSKAQKSSKLKSSPASNNNNNNNKQNTSSSSSSNESRYKNYAGIGPQSVKCYWEQENTSEIECQEAVYLRVAEDVTYKLWELGNVR